MMRRELIQLICIPLLMGLMGPVFAENKSSARDKHGVSTKQFTASFSGFNLQTRAVWLGDARFELYPGYKVVGKHSKRGTLSSIRPGEMVDVVIKKNKKSPRTPYLLEIRRRGK